MGGVVEIEEQRDFSLRALARSQERMGKKKPVRFGRNEYTAVGSNLRTRAGLRLASCGGSGQVGAPVLRGETVWGVGAS